MYIAVAPPSNLHLLPCRQFSYYSTTGQGRSIYRAAPASDASGSKAYVWTDRPPPSFVRLVLFSETWNRLRIALQTKGLLKLCGQAVPSVSTRGRHRESLSELHNRSIYLLGFAVSIENTLWFIYIWLLLITFTCMFELISHYKFSIVNFSLPFLGY